jgi:hypothetical protein
MADEIDVEKLMLLGRRDYDRQLVMIDKKLDQHSEQLENLRQTLSTIAVQSIQIQTLQAMQTEMRGDINEMYGRLENINNFQTTCPKKNLGVLWGVIIAMIMSMGGSFFMHVFGASK